VLGKAGGLSSFFEIQRSCYTDLYISILCGKTNEMKNRETILYSLMVAGSVAWLLSLIMILVFVVPNNEYEWTKWMNMLFFAIAILTFGATLLFSIFILAMGPKKARFAVFKWILLLLPSIMLVSHLVPVWIPIMFTIALVVLPARWLFTERNNEVKVNVAT
jgi:hypothetical protein